LGERDARRLLASPRLAGPAQALDGDLVLAGRQPRDLDAFTVLERAGEARVLALIDDDVVATGRDPDLREADIRALLDRRQLEHLVAVAQLPAHRVARGLGAAAGQRQRECGAGPRSCVAIEHERGS